MRGGRPDHHRLCHFLQVELSFIIFLSAVTDAPDRPLLSRLSLLFSPLAVRRFNRRLIPRSQRLAGAAQGRIDFGHQLLSQW
jgi:hypothetical protein